MIENSIGCLLESLHRIFILVRFKINQQYSIGIMENIQKILDKNILDYEILKKKILNMKGLDEYSRDYLDNALNTIKERYTDNYEEINKYTPVIKEAVVAIVNFLKERQIERAYDLIDAIHCLPVMLLDKKGWRPNGFWRHYINPYRAKWDKYFLVDQEKKIRKKRFLRLKL